MKPAGKNAAGLLNVLPGLLLTALLTFGAPNAHAANAGSDKGDAPASSQDSGKGMNGVAVLEQFGQQQQNRVDGASKLSDVRKHTIMFWLALPLLLMLLTTSGLGVATGIFGKRLFIPHMICAGLTLALVIAHAIAGIVWFYPF